MSFQVVSIGLAPQYDYTTVGFADRAVLTGTLTVKSRLDSQCSLSVSVSSTKFSKHFESLLVLPRVSSYLARGCWQKKILWNGLDLTDTACTGTLGNVHEFEQLNPVR